MVVDEVVLRPAWLKLVAPRYSSKSNTDRQVVCKDVERLPSVSVSVHDVCFVLFRSKRQSRRNRDSQNKSRKLTRNESSMLSGLGSGRAPKYHADMGRHSSGDLLEPE